MLPLRGYLLGGMTGHGFVDVIFCWVPGQAFNPAIYCRSFFALEPIFPVRKRFPVTYDQAFFRMLDVP
jgi:hypothetical protein